jgi:hypothetical protein
VPSGDAIVDPALHPQLVGYDFSNATTCGPDKGKSIALTEVDYKPGQTQKSGNKT